MIQLTEPITDLSSEVKRYFNLRLNYFTLLLSRRFAVFTSFLIMAIIFAGIIGFILLMLSFAFVFWYGKVVGTYYHGFMIVGLFYAVVGLLVLLFHKQLLVDPIIRKLNQNLESLEDEDDPAPQLHTLKDIDHQAELLRLKIQRSELLMQKKLHDIGESINPINIVKNVVGSIVSSSTLITTAMELAITYLRNNKEKHIPKSEQSSDEQTTEVSDG